MAWAWASGLQFADVGDVDDGADADDGDDDGDDADDGNDADDDDDNDRNYDESVVNSTDIDSDDVLGLRISPES